MLVNIGPYESYDGNRERTIVVRIDNYDVWNLDHTLSLIMLPAFTKLREKLNGYPASFDSMEEWQTVLDKIIRAHTLMLDESVEEFLHDGHPLNMEVVEGLELMAKYWGHFWT